MQRREMLTFVVSYAVLGTLVWTTGARAGPEVCASGGGPTICVRFDNLPDSPIEHIDFRFDVSTDPENPSIELLRGMSLQGTLYQWRVWSHAGEGPGNIGSISAYQAYDYEVRLLNPANGAGAANVSDIDLLPAGNHYSSLTGSGDSSRIAGDLSGILRTVADSAGFGGGADIFIGGNVSGEIEVQRIDGGSWINIQGDVSGAVNIEEIDHGEFVCGEDVSGNIRIGSAFWAILLVGDDLLGRFSVQSLRASTLVIAGDLWEGSELT